MSTRAQIRFATREAGQSFNQHPSAIHAQFYNHSDGYPEGLGINIAESLVNSYKVELEIQSLTAKHGDLDYIYYIWQAPGKETFISIFEVYLLDPFGNYGDECIFVGTPTELINKYSQTRNES